MTNIVLDEQDSFMVLNKSDLIIANRINDEIKDVVAKVYSRDLFNSD